MDPEAAESKAWVTIAVVSTTLSIALVALGLRVFTRSILVKQFGADDWAALVAGFCALTCGLLVAINIKYGLGRHARTLTPEDKTNYFKIFYHSIVFYNATLTSVKLTFLLQYYRVFAVQEKMRRAIIFALVIVGCWCLSQLLIVIFTCSPIKKFWTPTLPGTCIPNLPFWYINAAGNLATDVAIFLLPLPALSTLNLRKPQKLFLMGIFSLGFFTCAISVIRFRYLRIDEDFSWENVETSSWSVGELSSALTCVCLPTLRPLFIGIVPGMSPPHSGARANEGYWEQTDDPRRLRSGSSRKPASEAACGSQERLYDDVELVLACRQRPSQQPRLSGESGHPARNSEHSDDKILKVEPLGGSG
ncbi:hypothetical protein DL764_006651 [Monosporascus ibericus]|uniref:Rhodopsin domain-containing protein n=1 Tax=Monosporascus ibericus TaxID=155417 RepID=A0A4Q4T6K1_9PEZI|nr:hypothetical protein DL764_006651 [Monosporascus ibericus]